MAPAYEKRLETLEGRIEHEVEVRMEKEWDRFYNLLEIHLSPEEFARVLKVAAAEDTATPPSRYPPGGP